MRKIMFGDNLDLLEGIKDRSVDFIYVDPPFNTGRRQSRVRTRTVRDPQGDRTGFQGKRYRTEHLGESGYPDAFDDYAGFLAPRFEHAKRILKDSGSLFVHIDYREAHYVKVQLDALFGRDHFQNEIIWAYDYGARSKRRWSAKHDNLLWYVMNPKDYTFNYEDMDRIPYMAPGLVGPEKAAKGKTPTDVWWHTIVSPQGKERTGYPTQKPVRLLERILRVHTHPEDTVMDCFAGSGTLGEAALNLGRGFILMDNNPEAVRVMAKRFAGRGVRLVGCDGVLESPRTNV